jgi:hemolysin activation/secretion protein
VLTTGSWTLAECAFALAAVIALDGPAATAVAAPAPPPTASAEKAAPSPASVAYFNVHEYRVLGNTTLDNREIEKVLYPLLGDHKSLTDVEAARSALEKTYHDRGFSTVFVDIPEQEVADEIVRLKVTEGRLHEVHISGARYFSERKIVAALPSATAGKVPNVPVLQQELSEVNIVTADRSVVPILKAGPFPGTVDLTLKVDDHLPVHGSLEMDNAYTPYTEPLRATVSLSYADLFSDLDSIAVQYQVTPQNTSQVSVLAANYAWGALSNGLRPSIYFIDSNSNVPAVSTLGVLGKGQVYGTKLSFPLTHELGAPHTLTFGIDYKHFLESIAVAPKDTTSSPELVNTPISYTNLSFTYNGNWSTGVVQGALSAAADFGPRGAPNNPEAFANKRFKGAPNYFYMKLDGTFYVPLPVGFHLVLRADGQFAVEPLITNESFSITGANAVRGYLEAESLSDSGVVGSVQLQSPIWRVKSFPLIDGFVFFDAGQARVIDPLPGEPVDTTLRSYGAGFNLFPGRPVTGSLTWAYPLANGPNTLRGDSRLLFIVRGAF